LTVTLVGSYDFSIVRISLHTEIEIRPSGSSNRKIKIIALSPCNILFKAKCTILNTVKGKDTQKRSIVCQKMEGIV